MRNFARLFARIDIIPVVETHICSRLLWTHAQVMSSYCTIYADFEFSKVQRLRSMTEHASRI